MGRDDAEGDAEALAAKIAGLRIFADDDGKTNLDLADGRRGGAGGLAVHAVRGDAEGAGVRRSSGPPSPGGPRSSSSIRPRARRAGVRVGRGVFGADMEVDLVNDGPFTIVFDSSAP